MDLLQLSDAELNKLQLELKAELKSRTSDLRKRKRIIFNYSDNIELEILNKLIEWIESK